MNRSFEKLNDSIKSIKSLELKDNSEYFDLKIIDSGIRYDSHNSLPNLKDNNKDNTHPKSNYRNMSQTSKLNYKSCNNNSNYVDLNDASI